MYKVFRVKEKLRIGGAVALGILIILGALHVQNVTNAEGLAGQVIVSDVPNRTTVETLDADGNGIKDWQEDTLFETIDTPTANGEDLEPYIPPTTLTGKFSEAFFKDYLEGKMRGEDFSDPTAMVEKGVAALDNITKSPVHTRIELSVIPDSDEAFFAYGNQIAQTVLANQYNGERETEIFRRAVETKDAAVAAQIDPIIEVYTKSVQDLLQVDVPSSLIPQHLALINASEAIRTDTIAMRNVFSDPLFALMRTKAYFDDTKILYKAFANINVALSNKGVTYTSGDDGVLFYIFDSYE